MISLLLSTYLVSAGEDHAFDWDGYKDDNLLPYLECPKDSERFGDKCYKVVQSHPTIKCEKGAILKDGECISKKVYKAAQACEPGYDFHGNLCKKKDILVPQYYCKEGELIDGTCVTASSTKPHTMCPKSSIFKNGYCVTMKEVKPNAECAAGFTYIDGKCIHTTYSEVLYGCEDKSVVLDGEECISKKTKPFDSYCPKGYYIDQGGLCVGKVLSGPLVTCVGGELKGNKCVTTSKKQPKKRCKPHYTYDADSDLCVHVEKPTLFCDKDHEAEDDECVHEKLTESVKVCPKGTRIEGAKCVGYDYADAQLRCPPHYELGDGECVKISKKERLVYCPKGTSLSEDERFCVHETYASPKGVCERGEYDELKKKCLSESKELPKAACPKDYVLEDDECVREKAEKPEGMCPKGYKLEKEACVNELVTKPLAKCIKGGTAKGGDCVLHEEGEPILQCKPGSFYSDNKCNETIVQDATKKCALGYKLSLKDGFCHPIKSPKVPEKKPKEVKDVKQDMVDEIALKLAVDRAAKKEQKKVAEYQAMEKHAEGKEKQKDDENDFYKVPALKVHNATKDKKDKDKDPNTDNGHYGHH